MSFLFGINTNSSTRQLHTTSTWWWGTNNKEKKYMRSSWNYFQHFISTGLKFRIHRRSSHIHCNALCTLFRSVVALGHLCMHFKVSSYSKCSISGAEKVIKLTWRFMILVEGGTFTHSKISNKNFFFRVIDCNSQTVCYKCGINVKNDKFIGYTLTSCQIDLGRTWLKLWRADQVV